MNGGCQCVRDNDHSGGDDLVVVSVMMLMVVVAAVMMAVEDSVISSGDDYSRGHEDGRVDSDAKSGLHGSTGDDRWCSWWGWSMTTSMGMVVITVAETLMMGWWWCSEGW